MIDGYAALLSDHTKKEKKRKARARTSSLKNFMWLSGRGKMINSDAQITVH